MATDLTQNTRALKAIVIGLGVAIAVMFTVIVVTIVTRLSGVTSRGPATEATLQIAPGERVMDVAAAGQNVVVRVAGPAGERLLTVDPASGRIVAILNVASAPPSAPAP
jgi:hypothetical protein